MKELAQAATTARRIAQAAQSACLLEVCAPKPGNVNRHHDFAGTCFEDFLLSAVAIGPAMALAGRATVGRMVGQAIRDTQALVNTNTNLGIVLLLAPLAKACFLATRPSHHARQPAPAVADVQSNLPSVLTTLTVEDARQVYAAIRIAQPGGMGQVSQADLSGEPSITLLQAMTLAQERDAIAREYTTTFAITFGIAYPALQHAWVRSNNLSTAIVHAYLTILARVPDTLIARKRGPWVAGRVSQWAAEVLDRGSVFTAQGRARLDRLDYVLRDENHTLNPGTTADLTTAALFLLLYCSPQRRHHRPFASPLERDAFRQKEKHL